MVMVMGEWPGQGNTARERAVSASVIDKTDIFKLFSNSTAVQSSRQTIWFNVVVSLTIIRFISMRDFNYFRCISSPSAICN